MCDGSASHLRSVDIHIYVSLCLVRLIDTRACLARRKYDNLYENRWRNHMMDIFFIK